MRRIPVVLLAAFLLLAPAAMAKGPHVILTTPKEAVQAGKPWEATLEFNELRHVRNPVLTGTNRGRTVTAKLRPVAASMDDATGFKARTVFPADGRWAIAVTLNGRRFKFPAINVGSSEIVLSYVAFAEGSMADRQGGSGVYMAEDTSDTGPGTALSPEVITYDDVHPGEGGDGGGPEPWLFALGGVVLAGAGVMTVRRRR